MQRAQHVQDVRAEGSSTGLYALRPCPRGKRVSRPAFLEHVVLRLALAGLIADRAVERMVDEEELEDAFARAALALWLLTCTT